MLFRSHTNVLATATSIAIDNSFPAVVIGGEIPDREILVPTGRARHFPIRRIGAGELDGRPEPRKVEGPF